MMKTENLKQICNKKYNNDCKQCKFNIPDVGKDACQLVNLSLALSALPAGWDVTNNDLDLKNVRRGRKNETTR